jgi:integrase/recombinase XerD
MRELIDQFLGYTAQKRSSTNTVAAYRNDLSQFLDFLSGRVSGWSEVDQLLIAEYIAVLESERGYASSTVARKTAAIKSFFHYLAAHDILPDDPTVTLDSPRVQPQVPRAISPEQVDRLLTQPDHAVKTRGLRDRALLELLYATGLRVTELVALDVDDVSVPRAVVRVARRKNGRERLVPIHDRAVAPLHEYLEHGRDQLVRDPQEPALFLNHRGHRLTRQGLWLIVKQYSREVGIQEDVTPHTLRHTIALHMLDQNADPEYVQRLLGYASLTTTPIFRVVDGAPKAG